MQRSTTIIQAGVLAALFIAVSVLLWSYGKSSQPEQQLSTWVGNVG